MLTKLNYFSEYLDLLVGFNLAHVRIPPLSNTNSDFRTTVKYKKWSSGTYRSKSN